MWYDAFSYFYGKDPKKKIQDCNKINENVKKKKEMETKNVPIKKSLHGKLLLHVYLDSM